MALEEEEGLLGEAEAEEEEAVHQAEVEAVGEEGKPQVRRRGRVPQELQGRVRQGWRHRPPSAKTNTGKESPFIG